MSVTHFDTETSDLPKYSKPNFAPDQPFILQLAYFFDDIDGNNIHKDNRLMNWELLGYEYEINPHAFKAHGLTKEFIRENGLHPRDQLLQFCQHFVESDIATGYNVSFDLRLLKIAASRLSLKYPAEELWRHVLNKIDAIESRCVMLAMTKVCKIPGPRGIKWPKLQEAYTHVFGAPFEGAHDALADIGATRRLYYKIIWNNKKPLDKI